MKESKPENPKAAWGSAKASTFCLPPVALFEAGAVMAGGGYKYGNFNFRETRIHATTYYDAIQRHLALWFDGEDTDPMVPADGGPPGSGLSHLAHVIACCALMLDAYYEGNLEDDREKTGELRGLLEEYADKQEAFKRAYDSWKEAQQ